MAVSAALAAKVADLSSIPHGVTSPIITAEIYRHNFAYLGLAGIILAALLMMLTPWLKRMLDQQDEPATPLPSSHHKEMFEARS